MSFFRSAAFQAALRRNQRSRPHHQQPEHQGQTNTGVRFVLRWRLNAAAVSVSPRTFCYQIGSLPRRYGEPLMCSTSV